MKSHSLSNGIFLANYIVGALGIAVLLGFLSHVFSPKHNEFYLGLVKFSDVFGFVIFLYWLVGPSLFTLFVSFVISRFFQNTPSAIAAIVSSILSISSALFAYYYVWFIDTSEGSWMLLIPWPVVQFAGYITVLVITWLLAKLIAFTIRSTMNRSEQSVKQPAP